jgi:hypothetical protein
MNIKYLDVYQDIFFKIFKYFEMCFLVMGASTPMSQSGFPLPCAYLSSGRDIEKQSQVDKPITRLAAL